jgi:accessory gene regulator protein AgrB
VTPQDHQDELRRRQKSRALVMALILGGFVLLIYAITIAKLGIAL